MAYKSYTTKQYEHTHENSFFRVFSAQLRKTLHETDGLHVLIGNVSCNGHQIDALFISRGKIIVIDFKNYGGILTFSENNPWQIATENDFVFVKGGGGIRNPYQQVNAYRHSLMQYLSNRLSEILEPNHEDFNLGHISTLVLFQQPVRFNKNSISQILQKYFSIADNNTCIATILDQNSIQLNLSDVEIENILSALDIREENLYDEIQNPAIVTEPVLPDAVERLEQVRKELAKINFTDKSEISKQLLYYQTIISLERIKEPNVNEGHIFHIKWENIVDSVVINLERNAEFHLRFQKNMHQQFPKNLFIGINILFNSQPITLLSNVIFHRDILSNTSVESLIKDFTLYAKPLEDRNYPEELIEELASAIIQQTTINEKLEVLRGYLDGSIELVENITLAFSEENPFSSQLLSEIKKINQDDLVLPESLLEKFLIKKPVLNNLIPIESSEFIQISPLNVNQKEAVRLSFNQPLTVITGPPGTGKTQVVLNILANAVALNKKVLLASKNNQAVDNVKERLSYLIKEPNYFLRFGSKTEIRDKTVPTIQSFVTRLQNNLFDDNKEKLISIQRTINDKKKEVENAVERLGRRRKLENDIPELLVTIKKKEQEFQDWLASKENESILVFSSYPKESLLSIISQNNTCKNVIESRYKGIGKLFFNILSNKKYALSLTASFESLPQDLKALALKKSFQIRLNDLKSGGIIISTYSKFNEYLEYGILLQEKKIGFENHIAGLKSRLSEMQNEVENILNNEDGLKKVINEGKQIIDSLGSPLLDELIHQKICTGNTAEINNFKDYIPDNIPWKDHEIPEFNDTANIFLETFNITAITSLSIKSAFPLSHELFDLVVIDEASQCDIASALPLILRTKQLVVIGDPLQLKHISKVQSYEEKYILTTMGIKSNLRLNYVSESLYDYCYNLCISSKSQSVLLKEHFRCHPDIIGYSNKAFYGPKLGQELDIKTTGDSYKIQPKGIHWINVIGTQHIQKNSNQSEITKAIGLACDLASKHPEISIGITTPFAQQAKELNEAIPSDYKERIKADTVHRFQGDEKDIMILSLVITHNSPKFKAEWINKKVPFLINVAVTRARNTLYIVGNSDYCGTLPIDSPLGILVKYVNGINPIKK